MDAARNPSEDVATDRSEDGPPRAWTLAGLLALSPAELDHLCDSADERYRLYPLRTARKTRWIEAPDDALKAVQRRLLDGLLYRLAPTACAHGFVPGRSILTHARTHCGRRWVVTADIRRCFPSITGGMVAAVAGELALGEVDRRRFVRLVTREDHLPQGAPTSPHLANLVLCGLDEDLAAVAARRGWRYSRYADDLAFSGPDDPRAVLAEVEAAVRRHGFRLAPGKTRTMGRDGRQRVTGLVVNERPSLPREDRRWLRAVLHRARTAGWDAVEGPSVESFRGYVAFAEFVSAGAERPRREGAACHGHGSA